MGGYLVNFSVYTMAMIGLIFFALMIYKKFSADSIMSKKSNILSVEESINIAPRKNLYIIKAGNERFLIAGDVDKTTLISKLDEPVLHSKIRNQDMSNINLQRGIEELPDITSQRPLRSSQSNVLHNLARRINQ